MYPSEMKPGLCLSLGSATLWPKDVNLECVTNPYDNPVVLIVVVSHLLIFMLNGY